MSKYDLVLLNGLVFDGSGAPPFKADIAISGDKIVKVGSIDKTEAEKSLDLTGYAVAPGFIDIHNHSDLSIFSVPTADNYIRQGVTTIVVGNCGSSPAPITDENREYIEDVARRILGKPVLKWSSFDEYLDSLSRLKKSINVATLVGHGAIRAAVMGFEDRSPSEKELNEMKKLVDEALASGAFGLSTGLMYVPGAYSSTEEIIELAKIVGKYRGLYASHIRNEGTGLIDSVLEAIRIGLEAGVSVEISHLKAAGKPNWGRVKIALALIKEYAERGYDISADAYPYTASSTSLLSIFPAWVREGDKNSIINRLKDPEVLEEIRKNLETGGLVPGRWIEWNEITISTSQSHKELEGRRLNEIASEWDMDPMSTAIKILLDDELSTSMIVHGMSQEDVDLVISNSYVAIGSDGSVKQFGKGKPHPRNYGAFPRVLSLFVRKKKLLSLSEAIRKMTSLPARKLRLWDRGLIRPGMKADITVFNMYTIEDKATYEYPHQYPQGIKHVIVNGKLVVEDGQHKEVKPGKLIKPAR